MRQTTEFAPKRTFIFSANPLLPVLLLCLVAGVVSAQSPRPDHEWTHLPGPPPGKAAAARWVQPLRGELFQLDSTIIRSNYTKIPQGQPSEAKTMGRQIELPMPDGTMARFFVVEAPVMDPELAAKFPEIKTYAGVGIDDPQASVRLDLSPAGFHAQVLSPHGAVYVDPAYRNDAVNHVSYYKRDYSKTNEDWQCLAPDGTAGRGTAVTGTNSGGTLVANAVLSGATLKTYRLAVACTAEYAAFFGGTVSNAVAAIVTAVNRVDGVYETELAVRLVLIGKDNLIVFTNSATEPYSNNNGSTMLGQNQTTIDSIIGSANYDIGHVFSTGGGGIAQVGCVCVAGSKAQGVTGNPAPTGDSFWIDYVAHEMGHQFGGQHTFNSTNNNCGGGNRNASTAYEPGSGLTIMAYAGICSPDDLQPHSDPFFHGVSLDEIQAYITSGNGSSCPVSTATGNTAPTVSAGANYTIPAATPFVLTATGSDPNGDTLTYCWEEFDLGTGNQTLTGLDPGTGPLFRDFPPTNSPSRYFPKISSVLANTNWNQEVLPTTSRTMTFRVTARDNRAGGGGVSDAQMTVTSVASTSPFIVTAPVTNANWSGARTVTWNVAGTTNAPVSAATVNILLSTNSGLAFPFLLATNVPNNGSAAVILPNLITAHARILVQANGKIFFNINRGDFNVLPGSPVPFLQLTGTALTNESCLPTNGAIDPYETVNVNWTIANLGSAPTTNLVATLLATNGVFYPGGPQTYGVISAGGNVTRPFTFTPAGICGGSVTGVVQLVDGASSLGTLSTVFPLGATQTTVTTNVFNNAGFITINDNASATPYPSTIAVAGVSGTVTNITATINGWSHTYASDVGMLLVGPGGQTVKLLDAIGGSSSISGIVLTLDDAASSPLSPSTVTSGTFQPTDLDETQHSFNSPAPAYPYGTTLLPLAATPNGTWSLYVEDFYAEDSGSISGGWSLKFITTSNTTVCCSTFPQPTLTSTTYSNRVVRFNWNSLPGPHYQVQCRTNLVTGTWSNLGAAILGTNTITGIIDITSNSPTRFYRVNVGP
ncbi:MAG TPA: zinc-dependent metalloprotease family protein [Candidatus Acidoferrales bacterium]|nr:zinc-dependent metalloprotease family protein [Candidatus Acidoferrales bacterium]